MGTFCITGSKNRENKKIVHCHRMADTRFCNGDFDQFLYEVLKRHQKSYFPLGMAYDVLWQAVLGCLGSRHVKNVIL